MRASGCSAATSAGPSRRSACASARLAFICRRFSSRKRSCSRSPMPNSRAPRGGRTRARSIRCPVRRRARRRWRYAACARSGSSPRRSRSLSGLTRLRAQLGPRGRARSTSPTRCLRIWAGGATTRITSCARLALRACARRRRRRARLISPPGGVRPIDAQSRADRDPVRRACGAYEAGGASDAPPQAQARPGRRTRCLMTEDACRIDVWLWRARFFKTRSLAARIVEEGGVRLSRGQSRAPVDKPSRPVRCGDLLSFAQGPEWVAVRVEAFGERRGPATEARALYSALNDSGARATSAERAPRVAGRAVEDSDFSPRVAKLKTLADRGRHKTPSPYNAGRGRLPLPPLHRPISSPPPRAIEAHAR